MSGRPCLLVINAGSSSVKFQLYSSDGQMQLAGGSLSGIGDRPVFEAALKGEKAEPETWAFAATQEDGLRRIVRWLESSPFEAEAVVHRIVHGGTAFTAPTVLNQASRKALGELTPLAPLHQPHNLAAVELFSELLPDVPQIGCFDTAFHAGLPPLSAQYALPGDARMPAVRRYGFHGLSYEWIARALKSEHPKLFAGRVVAAHLGNGSSLCAMQSGRSVDTTMGMSSLEGVPMGTRSGSIDPGALIYLLREQSLSPDDLEDMLYRESGLKGLSGISGDVRALLESDDKRAAFALEFFAHKVAQHIAMLAVSLGGLPDALVFTGGIGENASAVREDIARRLPWKQETVLVIPAGEERIMAMHAAALLGWTPNSGASSISSCGREAASS